MLRLLKSSLRLGLLLAGLAALVWLGCELAVEIAASGRCYDSLDRIPARHAGLVLGTAKFVPGGSENIHYKYRIDAAVELFKAGKVERLIVSGNGKDPYYNEPRRMRADLIARGVPEGRIACDEAGLRTFDSVFRAAEEFGEPDCIVISQPAHTKRAVFIGRAMGKDMIGWDARNVSFWKDPRTAVRERLARILAVLDVTVLDKKPQVSDTDAKHSTASAP